MALKANRNGNAGAKSNQQAVNGGNQVEENNQEQTQTTTTPATTNQANKPAVNNPNQMAIVNDGILDNIEDMNIGGSYVTVDGSEFLFKATDERVNELDIVVSYGKRFYQYYDEAEGQYHNADTKLDDRYKLKFEIRWVDEEGTEHIMTLPTSSAMNFITYVKQLAQQGFSVGAVVTRLTVSRQQSQDGKYRYSRVEFENAGNA